MNSPFLFAPRRPMATRRTDPPETLTETILAALAFVFLLAVLISALYLADAIINVPVPTERCFDGAVAEMNYCRTQLHWSN